MDIGNNDFSSNSKQEGKIINFFDFDYQREIYDKVCDFCSAAFFAIF